MHPITQPFTLLWRLRECPAGATLLRRVGRWDRDDPHAGPFRLAVQDGKESAPADIVSRPRQARARDALDVQGFMRDQAVLADELASDLMVKVAPLIGDVQVVLGESLHGLLATIAPLLLAS